jgi:alkaline phosphatase D
MTTHKLRRREMMAASAGSLLATQLAPLSTLAADDRPAHQASGVKVGEVTDSSAIVWTRLTEHPTRNKTGVVIQGRATAKDPGTVTVPITDLEGACPGAEGQVRVRYGVRDELNDAIVTPWASVSRETDFTHQFALRGLKADTVYHYAVETTGPGGSPQHGVVKGRFETAPVPTTPSDFRFCVMTCQAYHDRDHVDGHHIYPSMLALSPKFVAFTGDNVYYDSDQPKAVSAELARYHWQRMFSLPRQIELLRNVGSYWEKDDHDCLSDDSWPGSKMGDLTFAEGQTIFRQQAPMGETIYRTFRWGRDLQIWLTDGRDFRSPNSMPDGPEK